MTLVLPQSRNETHPVTHKGPNGYTGPHLSISLWLTPENKPNRLHRIIPDIYSKQLLKDYFEDTK